ncbi:derlin-1.1-like [Prosopis cineraria]|uniref:derlin-1.1-like n=1 Tax=Prosopis cineraria TaxID=364024 RepID=UPI00240F7445|nr:derlin-1.1-like [Prosopis cineraria]
MGIPLVFMITYVWSREFPDARINIYGVVSLKGFYLPWAMLGLDLIFGNSLKPGITGMVAGHLYYFLTVLYPLSGGKFTFKTPLWVHKIVAYWGEGTQVNSPVHSNPTTDGIVFRGRSFRLGGTQTRMTSNPQGQQNESNVSPQQQNQGNGIAFRGRSYRLNG